MLNAYSLKENIDKTYYQENSDGSVDLELTLYYLPQSYFIIGFIVSLVTFIGSIVGLIIFFKEREKIKITVKNNDRNRKII